MRARVVIAALCGLLAGGPAWAQDDRPSDNIVDLFQHICFETQGDLAAALVVSQKYGWMPFPNQMIDKLSKPDIQLKQAFLKSDKSRLWMTLFFDGDRAQDTDFKYKGCGVVTKPPVDAASDIRRQLEALVPGIKGVSDLSDLLGNIGPIPKSVTAAYAWRMVNSVPTPVDVHASDVKTAAENGDVYIMALAGDDEMSAAFLINPHK